MDVGNRSSVLKGPDDFDCCCSIDRNYFLTDGTNVVQIVNAIFTVPSALTAVVGNVLVLTSIWKTPSLHSQSNLLIAGLAVSDVGVGLAAQPVFLVLMTAKIKRLATLFCHSALAFAVVSRCLCSFSFLLLILISVDRYIALRLHLRYQELVTSKRTLLAVIATGVTSLVFGVTVLWNSSVINYVSVVFIVIGFSTTNFSYFKIGRVVAHHRRQIRQAQVQASQNEQSFNMGRYRSSFVSMLLVYFLFLLCYTPYLVATVVMVSTGISVATTSALEVAMLIMCMNSALNPMVYCWRFRGLRTAVVKTARSFFHTEHSFT